MEGVDDTNPTLTLEEGENNPFSSFDDKTLMMMDPSLMFSSDMGPSSSCSPASFYMSAQPENFQHAEGGGDAEEIGGLSDHNKNSKGKGKRSSAMQRIAFHTRSDDDVLDDGYKWRKYGQKSVKNNAHPRSYYRCTYHTCNVKKQVQRLAKDPKVVVTTYEGVHNHPCEKLMETLSPLLRQLQFLTRVSDL
ncbi:putative WRKY transcription factor 56 [Raphanus sativus]|uniref:Probable WRKY transcription factor 56 isoform X2 n=1 Tax=Raphanus sativus TaxID=3726 RepID=A0A6J0L330_RAPSA|nr:probable WRKY transcription factor 56 isoform X2 [Raphanus sativus]KAJ4877152.1 putative WRKY transcription factor 56 [Raphanus sativus]